MVNNALYECLNCKFGMTLCNATQTYTALGVTLPVSVIAESMIALPNLFLGNPGPSFKQMEIFAKFFTSKLMLTRMEVGVDFGLNTPGGKMLTKLQLSGCSGLGSSLSKALSMSSSSVSLATR
jgi:hypothetical protein